MIPGNGFANRQQTVAWTNDDQTLHCHMVLLGQNVKHVTAVYLKTGFQQIFKWTTVTLLIVA